MKKTLAIIPARGGSKRLPGKNVREFLGYPLIHWSIIFARSIPQFDKVAVSTDSEEIADVCRSIGQEVAGLRPAVLATDTATSADVVLDVLDREQKQGRFYDRIALLQPTSPMREASRWEKAFACMESPDTEAVIGVGYASGHPTHMFHVGDDGFLVRDEAAAPDGARERLAVLGNLYLIRTDVLEVQRTFFPPRTVGVVCDKPYEMIDIDTKADWIAAVAFGKQYGRTP
ncbi:MAG TPA: acylneuraminate cytidylyltransferase family protein [Afipia sp.]